MRAQTVNSDTTITGCDVRVTGCGDKVTVSSFSGCIIRMTGCDVIKWLVVVSELWYRLTGCGVIQWLVVVSKLWYRLTGCDVRVTGCGVITWLVVISELSNCDNDWLVVMLECTTSQHWKHNQSFYNTTTSLSISHLVNSETTTSHFITSQPVTLTSQPVNQYHN
jgi:predicted small lipoprotein YifL